MAKRRRFTPQFKAEVANRGTYRSKFTSRTVSQTQPEPRPIVEVETPVG